MYQDLFLTDMKREVEDAQSKLKLCKQETNLANREIVILRKEQAQLQATLKRYRKMVQEMSHEMYPSLAKSNEVQAEKTERTNAHKRLVTKVDGKFDLLSTISNSF